MILKDPATESTPGNDDANALADLYGFFALCMRYPDPAFLDQKFLTTFQDLLHSLGRDSQARETGTWLEQDSNPLETLQIEYTRLFINAIPHAIAPPYASIYIGGAGSLQGKITEETRDFYRQCGFDLTDETEPADHIMHELEFLAQLTREGRLEEAEEFLHRFFRPWFERFYQRVHNEAGHLFYRVSVELIDFFTKEEP
ncbi:TorD/DmsD family molecular chaperone [Desulfolithobacter sp.]